MTNDKTALDALDRLENDALSGRDGYGDARKDAEIIRNFINTRPQPSGDAVEILNGLCSEDLGHGEKICLTADEIKQLRAALTQPKADVEGLKSEAWHELQKQAPNCNVAWAVNFIIDHLAAQGYIGAPEGWRDISTIPDDVMSGVDLWDDRNEKRHINCTFNLRLQAWADENFSFVEIPTHWMPIPAAPKKEV